MARKKSSIITVLVVVGILVLAGVIIYTKSNSSGSGVSADLAKCIGAHSQEYVQLGCEFCAEQKALFGNSYQYINSTDCYQENNRQFCNQIGIVRTPTWIINGTQYQGVQSIDELKNLTGC